MKDLIRLRKHPTGEDGMALGITLVMGLMLSMAASGLLAKQMMVRRLGVAESNKQIAEMAAVSGMNRLLAAMNETGSIETNELPSLNHLWELDHDNNFDTTSSTEQQWLLKDPSVKRLLSQPCQHSDTANEKIVEILEDSIANGSNIRERSKDGETYQTVQSSYRMRSYKNADTSATFEIEGYATQKNGEQILSRSLLTRILSVEPFIASQEHWAVLAGTTMQLGDSRINGPGSALWLLDKTKAQNIFVSDTACSSSSLSDAVGSNNYDMTDRIWPKASDSSQFPSASLFSDSHVHNGQLYIDDSLSEPIRSNGTAINLTGSVKKDADGKVTEITLHSEALCGGKNDKPCVVIVEAIKLQDAIFSIETGKDSGKPVILRLLKADTQFDIGQGSLCQAASSSSDETTLPCDQNAKAERLVIYAPEGDEADACNIGSNNLILNHSNALPAGIVLLPKGKTSIQGSPVLNGLLWSHSICTNTGGITLNTVNAIEGFRDLWASKNYNFGRTTWRGVRGKQHDVFRRW